MEKKKPVFDYDICVACGICTAACLVSCIELEKTDVDKHHKAYPVMVEEGCTGCGICAKSCPLDAIVME